MIRLDDDFIPKVRGLVECREVVSKYRSREYVLIHPNHEELEQLGVKDFFIWNNINGQKSLAEHKQDYYKKFGTLPTEHLQDCIRDWLNRGLLEGGEGGEENTKKSSLGQIRLGAKKFKKFPGLVFRPFNSPLFLIASVTIFFVSMVVMSVFEGLHFFAVPLQSMNSASFVLLELLASFYLFAWLRCFVRLGLLGSGTQFEGDDMALSLIPYPKVSVSLKGLVLKPWEKRITHHMICWFLPAGVAGFLFLILKFSPEIFSKNISFGLSVLALAGLVDFIATSCPFNQSYVVRALDEWTGGRSVTLFSKIYLKNRTQFLIEKQSFEVRAVHLYLIWVILWTVLGSSLLIHLSIQLADRLAEEIQMSVGIPRAGEWAQYILYIPIVAIFVYFFWKLLQPSYENIRRSELWSRPAYLSTGLIWMSVVSSLIYLSMPRVLSLGLVFSVFMWLYTLELKKMKNVAAWLRWHLLARVGSFFLLTAYLFSQGVVIPMLLVGVWTLWLIRAISALSSPSSKWVTTILVCIPVCVVGTAAIPLALGHSYESAAWALPVGVSLCLLFAFQAKRIGIHFLEGFVALSLMALAVHPEIPMFMSEALMTGSLVLLHLQALALNRSISQQVSVCSQYLIREKESFPSIQQTLANFSSSSWGSFVLSDSMGKRPKDFHFLRDYETWLKKWLTPSQRKEVLKTAFAVLNWEERMKSYERVASLKLQNLEGQMGLSAKERTKLLMNQFFFKGFSAKEIGTLAEMLEPRVYKEGEVLARAGEVNRPCLEMIFSGAAQVEGWNDRGEKRIVAELRSGDPLRNQDLMRDLSYLVTVRCTQETLCLRLYRKHFIAWCSDPDVLAKVKESTMLSRMVSELSLFRDFSSTQIRLLLGHLKRREIKRGETIIQQGDEGDEFYLIREGEVDILVDEKKVNSLDPGSYFGEIALIERCKRTATVRASCSSVVYSLDKGAFQHFFAKGRGAQVLKNVSEWRAEDSHEH